MLDQHDGDAELVAHLADELHHVGGFARVHARGRLVEHEKLGLGRQRPADLQAALLAIGEVAGEQVAAAAQPDELQQLQRLVMRARLVDAGCAAY